MVINIFPTHLKQFTRVNVIAHVHIMLRQIYMIAFKL